MGNKNNFHQQMEMSMNMLKGMSGFAINFAKDQIKQHSPEHAEIVEAIFESKDSGIDGIKKYISEKFPDKKDEVFKIMADEGFEQKFKELERLKETIMQ